MVNWAVNSVNVTKNKTQHGEVRLIQSYLEKDENFNLKLHTIYTTLEPCAMCSGMMTLTQLCRTVYGQTDPAYGKALERLQLNSIIWDSTLGYKPYPRGVFSDKSPDAISSLIDDAYSNYSEGSLTKFLATDEARKFYGRASDEFDKYRIAKDASNQQYIDSAHAFFDSIPDSTVH